MDVRFRFQPWDDVEYHPSDDGKSRWFLYERAREGGKRGQQARREAQKRISLPSGGAARASVKCGSVG